MAIEKELIGRNGEKRTYFKIKRVVLNYETGYFAIECSSYTNANYRNKEKEEVKTSEMEKALWELLNEKEEKTPEELIVWSRINYEKINKVFERAQELKLKDEVFMVSLENQDLRDVLYNLLKETAELQGATDVLENNNSLTKEEIEKELEKRIEEAKKELPIVGQTEEVVRDQNGGL